MKDGKKQALRRQLPGLAAGSVSVAALLTASVQAQAQEGPLLVFDLSLGGQYERNDPDEDESRLTADVGVLLSSSTRTQSFRLATDGRFTLEDGSLEFEQPGLQIDYAREIRSAALDASLSYGTEDVAGATELIDPITGNILDLVNDSGTLETVQFSAGLETGREARFGTSTRVSFTDRTYSGTSDPSLIDLESWQIGTTLSFDVSPMIDLQATASHRITREDDAENTETRTSLFGLDSTLQVDPLWTVTTGLTYTISETETDAVAGGRLLEEEESGGISVTAQRQFRNGTLGASFARNIIDTGSEDTLRVLGARNLANGGDLSWSLGVVSFPGGDTSPLFSASYSLPTPRGGLSIDFAQTTTTDEDDNSFVSTSLDVGWNQQINASSSWSLNGSFSSVNAVSDAGEDQARAQVGVSYNHALTRSWDFATALSHAVTYEGGAENESASTLSFSLQRSFSLRP